MAQPTPNSSSSRILITLGAVLLAVIVAGRASFKGSGTGAAPAPETISQVLDARIPEGEAPLDGQYIVLEFWATWCGPCRAVIPHMNELVAMFRDAPVRFISLSDEAPEVVAAFVENHEMAATIATDPEGHVFSAFGIVGIPHAVVLDPERNVIYSGHPARLTAAELAEMMGLNRQDNS